MVKINYAIREDPASIFLLEDAGKRINTSIQISSFQRRLLRPEFYGQYFYVDELISKYMGEPTKTGYVILDNDLKPSFDYIALIDCQIEFQKDYIAINKLSKNYMPAWDVKSYLDYFDDNSSCVLLLLKLYKVDKELNKKYLIKGNKGSSTLVRLYDGENEVTLNTNIIEPVISNNRFEYIKTEIIHLLKTEDVFIASYESTESGKDLLESRIVAYRNVHYDSGERKFNPNSSVDMAKIDYQQIYNDSIKVCPNFSFIINYVKDILPARLGEYTYLLKDIHEHNNNELESEQRLFEMSLRFAVKNALYYNQKYGVDIEDAFQEACLGIIYAIRKHSDDVEALFASYASLWMTQNMNRDLPLYQPNVSVPTHYFEYMLQEFKNIENYFDDINLKDLSYSDMMNALVKYAKTDIRTANMIAFVVVPFIRLDNIADIDSTETYFSPDNNEFINEVQKSLNKWFLNERLFIAINKLSEKERNIIVKRFGLYGNDEMTLEELGLQLGLTRERVRQIEKRALERLKNHLDNIKDELFECC